MKYRSYVRLLGDVVGVFVHWVGARTLPCLGSAATANISLNKSRTFMINSWATLTIAPILLDYDGGAGSLVKAGTGTLHLNGNNTYTGTTTINAGTVFVNGQTGTNSGTGTGAVTVASAASLPGDGRVAGALTVNNGGLLTAGNTTAPIGTLTLGSTLNMATNTTLGVRIGNAGVQAAVNTGNSSGAVNTVNNFLLIQGAATINSGLKLTIGGTGSTFASGRTCSYLIGDATNDLSGLNITTQGQFTFNNFNTMIVANSVSLRGASNGNIYLNFTTVLEPAFCSASGWQPGQSFVFWIAGGRERPGGLKPTAASP